MFKGIIRQLQYQSALRQIRNAGLWFVDIPHTSSSSIKVELYQCFGRAYGKSDLADVQYNIKNQPLPNHQTALQMRHRLNPRVWQRLFTFSIVRNPWDRMISHFQYRKAVGEINPTMGFRDYLQLFFERPGLSEASPFNYHGHYYQCADYLQDEEGHLMVDYIARFENREHDLLHISSRCNCHLGKLHLNRGRSLKSYHSFYNKETRDMVSRIANKDIEVFGYEF